MIGAARLRTEAPLPVSRHLADRVWHHVQHCNDRVRSVPTLAASSSIRGPLSEHAAFLVQEVRKTEFLDRSPRGVSDCRDLLLEYGTLLPEGTCQVSICGLAGGTSRRPFRPAIASPLLLPPTAIPDATIPEDFCQCRTAFGPSR